MATLAEISRTFKRIQNKLFIQVPFIHRRQEIVNAANAGVKMQMIGGQPPALKMPDEKEVLGLTEAIRELGVAERKARTSLWAALQITIDDAATPNATVLATEFKKMEANQI